tara:strand:- start:571 stop:918 length:348 start_codon:yes stop_codon:yes gene_type:complete
MGSNVGIERTGLFLVEVILAIAFVMIFMLAVTNFDSYSNTNWVYTQEDLVLLAETALAAPGEIEYNYQIKERYDVQEDTLIVSKTDSKLFSGNDLETLELKKEEGDKDLSITRHA